MSTWSQAELTLAPRPRGVHLVTREVEAAIDVAAVDVGLLHVHCLHTSASLAITENASPDVRRDLRAWLDVVAPEDLAWTHTLEGDDDMPAHAKAILTGPSLTVPVRGGRLALGTWQGIVLCEHRDRGGPRRLVLTLQGAAA
jgi:secondary thiamine-phosphate synthase enzyme